MGRLLTGPLAAVEEGSYVCHDEAQTIQDCPGDADTLQPGTAFIDGSATAGEIHHQQGHGGGHDCGDGGNHKNLGIDILHDLIGLRPNRGRCGGSTGSGCRHGSHHHCHHGAHGADKAVIGGFEYGRDKPLFGLLYRNHSHLQLVRLFQIGTSLNKILRKKRAPLRGVKWGRAKGEGKKESTF